MSEGSVNAESVRPFHIVGIGASAGGLEPIEAFFANTPSSTRLAFIVVQHLSPDHKSLMAEILSKKTTLPVHRVEDGMEIESGNVYLIPPDRNLTVAGWKLVLTRREDRGSINLPIDVLLKSLAEDHGEKTVAVVLSGSGSDGMRGVRAVKQNGGLIMVQAPDTAKFASMPRAAISTGLVDYILDPADMPGQLEAFAEHPCIVREVQRGIDDHAGNGTTRLFALLRDRVNIDFAQYKPSTVNRRIERRMTINQIDDIDDYVQQIYRNPGETAILARELLIGVTSFFRDPEVFEKLETETLPGLIRDKQRGELRVWVPGCSTGEEAYSIAILLHALASRDANAPAIKVFATDVDDDAVRYAANGSYPDSAAADIPPKYRDTCFKRGASQIHVARHIRELVVFAQHDVTKSPPFTKIDFLSCRNLLIYLRPAVQATVLDAFAFSLGENGILVLGTSETAGEAATRFAVVNQKCRIYRATGRQRGRAPGVFRGPTDTRTRELHDRFEREGRGAAREQLSMLDRLITTLGALHLSPGIVVDAGLEVKLVIGDCSPYVRFSTGTPTYRADKLVVRELATPLSTGVQKAMRDGNDVSYSGVRVTRGNEERTVDLEFAPLTGRTTDDSLVVIFFKKRQAEITVTATQPDYNASEEARSRIDDLERELQFSRENLQATVEELETSNEELQATNEELLASNEELQSTNEELQSTNEELFTVNAEYHHKIVELTEATNDVQNLLGAAGIATLVLDENLEIRHFSPPIRAIFDLREDDIGRLIASFAHQLLDFDPLGAFRAAVLEPRMHEHEVQNREGRWFACRIVPYTVSRAVYAGVVATFVDITSLKRVESSLRQNVLLLTHSEQTMRSGGWEYDVPTGSIFWTPGTYEVHGFSPDAFDPGDAKHIEESLACYDPVDRERVREAFECCISEGTSYDLTVRFTPYGSTERPIRTIGRAVREDGEIRRVIGTIMELDTQTGEN